MRFLPPLAKMASCADAPSPSWPRRRALPMCPPRASSVAWSASGRAERDRWIPRGSRPSAPIPAADPPSPGVAGGDAARGDGAAVVGATAVDRPPASAAALRSACLQLGSSCRIYRPSAAASQPSSWPTCGGHCACANREPTSHTAAVHRHPRPSSSVGCRRDDPR